MLQWCLGNLVSHWYMGCHLPRHPRSILSGGLATATKAEETKLSKYLCQNPHYSFSPVAIETLEAIGPKSMGLQNKHRSSLLHNT